MEEDRVELVDLYVKGGASPVQKRIPMFFLENHKWWRFILIKAEPLSAKKVNYRPNMNLPTIWYRYLDIQAKRPELPDEFLCLLTRRQLLMPKKSV
jgi:hypothetical protein